MRTLLIDMPSGVAGDMLLGALVGCGADLAGIRTGLLGLGLGPIGVTATEVRRGSLMGWQIDVDAPQEALWATGAGPHIAISAHVRPDARSTSVRISTPSAAAARPLAPPTSAKQRPDASAAHAHRPYRVIRDLIAAADLLPRVRDRAQAAFRLLAKAEAQVHGVTTETVEFHEVGGLDAIADIVGVCLALEQLQVERIISGPMLPGQGRVHCAHGEMPVPVPAVAHMLAHSGAPTRLLGWDSGELTTPTGCALVLSLAEAFIGGDPPAPELTGRLLATGNGAGHRDLARLTNLVRVSLFAVAASPQAPADLGNAPVVEARLQVDDATGEQLSALTQALLAGGALEVYLTAVQMKKGRPGHLLTMLCVPERLQELAALALAHSSSIGMRWNLCERMTLPRSSATIQVCGHAITMKVVRLADGSERAKPEADAVAAAAHALGRSFIEIQQAALHAWRSGAG